ncbi:unnamed protein product [Haemonchus placei]|uniref:Heparan-sulfate 6-O-sulfotransferase n=1 Tax=Haemonchus placei TaxID=6290 RepID=A0A158QPK0_HAEPC|nr:unnamed protein product [Haemonchus placei]
MDRGKQLDKYVRVDADRQDTDGRHRHKWTDGDMDGRMHTKGRTRTDADKHRQRRGMQGQGQTNNTDRHGLNSPSLATRSRPVEAPSRTTWTTVAHVDLKQKIGNKGNVQGKKWTLAFIRKYIGPFSFAHLSVVVTQWVVFVNISEYLPTTEAAGVHTIEKQPFPDSLGHSAPTGFVSGFGIKLVPDVENVIIPGGKIRDGSEDCDTSTSPYGDCIQEGKDEDYIYVTKQYIMKPGCLFGVLFSFSLASRSRWPKWLSRRNGTAPLFSVQELTMSAMELRNIHRLTDHASRPAHTD